MSDQSYWDSHLGFQSQGPIFLPPSLHPTAQLLPPAPGTGERVVSTRHLGAVSGHHITPATLSGLRWTFPALKLWYQQEKRSVSWILQPQRL